MIRYLALLTLVWLLGAPLVVGQEVFDPLDPTDDDAQTGIAVGEAIPPFEAVDQNGKSWTFESLRGPNGAVLVFHRSADW